MICCWFAVEPVKIGSRNGKMLLQPALSPAISASEAELAGELDRLLDECVTGKDIAVRIAELEDPGFDPRD